jgi:cytochrome c oxidase subunit 2
MSRLARRCAGLAAVALAGLTTWALAALPARGDVSQSTLDPKSDSAQEIADLWWLMLVVATLVVAVVLMLVALAVLRPHGRLSDRLASRLGGRWLVAVAGIGIPLVILVILFGLTLQTLVQTSPANLKPQMTIQVTGRQWFWDVRYPGREIVTANELHVPVGVPVEVEVRTADVIHSFWVPQLDRKIDLIPGRDNRVTFAANEAGVFRGECAEFCGEQHANMAFLVVAEPRRDFDAWLARMAAPALPPTSASAAAGRRVFFGRGCASCHTIAGTAARGDVGPDLTHLALRGTLAAGTLPNTRGDLGGWILNPQAIKPGNKMPAIGLSGPELQALLDYLEGLR